MINNACVLRFERAKRIVKDNIEYKIKNIYFLCLVFFYSSFLQGKIVSIGQAVNQSVLVYFTPNLLKRAKLTRSSRLRNIK